MKAIMFRNITCTETDTETESEHLVSAETETEAETEAETVIFGRSFQECFIYVVVAFR